MVRQIDLGPFLCVAEPLASDSKGLRSEQLLIVGADDAVLPPDISVLLLQVVQSVEALVQGGFLPAESELRVRLSLVLLLKPGVAVLSFLEVHGQFLLFLQSF